MKHSNLEAEVAPTPQPWAIEENVLAGNIIHLAITNRAVKDWMVCSVTPQKLARDIDYANARLIASAPALLEALKMALVQIHRDNDERKAQYRATEDHVRAAIALAEKE
jgi:hypothetical protein